MKILNCKEPMHCKLDRTYDVLKCKECPDGPHWQFIVIPREQFEEDQVDHIERHCNYDQNQHRARILGYSQVVSLAAE